jgi:uncharacterized membrane protein
VLKYIGLFCIFFIVIFVIAELLVQFIARPNCSSLTDCSTLQNVLVIIVRTFCDHCDQGLIAIRSAACPSPCLP